MSSALAPAVTSRLRLGAPRVSLAGLVVTLVVLGSHVHFIVDLLRSGVTSTSGAEAYGAPYVDLRGVLPPGVGHLVMIVLLLGVLLGPVVVLVAVAGAVSSLWTSWRERRSLDVPALGTVAAAVALCLLLGSWGDELWVWILD